MANPFQHLWQQANWSTTSSCFDSFNPFILKLRIQIVLTIQEQMYEGNDVVRIDSSISFQMPSSIKFNQLSKAIKCQVLHTV